MGTIQERETSCAFYMTRLDITIELGTIPGEEDEDGQTLNDTANHHRYTEFENLLGLNSASTFKGEFQSSRDITNPYCTVCTKNHNLGRQLRRINRIVSRDS